VFVSVVVYGFGFYDRISLNDLWHATVAKPALQKNRPPWTKQDRAIWFFRIWPNHLRATTIVGNDIVPPLGRFSNDECRL